MLDLARGGVVALERQAAASSLRVLGPWELAWARAVLGVVRLGEAAPAPMSVSCPVATLVREREHTREMRG